MKILIVDDERDIRDYLRRLLEIAGFQVIEADSGESALYALAKTPDVDLIILDWMMPGMNGEEVLKELQAQFEGIPVLMLSAKTGEQDILKALESGAIDYILKPLDKDHFIFKVRGLLKGNSESFRKHAARRKNVNFNATSPMTITGVSSKEIRLESNFPIPVDSTFIVHSDMLLRMFDIHNDIRFTCKATSCEKDDKKYIVSCVFINLSPNIAQQIEDAAAKASGPQ